MNHLLRRPLGLMATAALVAAGAVRADSPAPGTAPSSAAATASPKRGGDGPAFRTLADLPVLHVEDEGSRVKPIDTYARLKLKEIYGREQLKLFGADGALRDRLGLSSANRPTDATWTALGALVDWPLRPEFWDTQELILVDLFEYRGLKRELLASAIKDALQQAAGKTETSAADKAALEKLAAADEVSEGDLKALLASTQLAPADREILAGWAEKLEEGRKWIAPADLAAAQVTVGDQTDVAFLDWYNRLVMQIQQARREGQTFEPTPRERRVLEMGRRLLTYQSFRDRNPDGDRHAEILAIPRPYDARYLEYNRALVEGLARAEDRNKQFQSFSDFDRDVFATLSAYLADIRSPAGYLDDIAEGKQKPPGQDPKFDQGYAKWLRDKSAWLPVRLIQATDLDALDRAGIDRTKVEAFRQAYSAFEAAERSEPGQATEAAAQSLVAAARSLGEQTNPVIYPPAAAMARETHFNRFAPFSQAPIAYGLGLVLLLVSLGATGRAASLSYSIGMLAFVAGIALEVYGFYLRVRISGWAPVTNMYETVIWVAAVAAVLGLVLELIYRRKFAAIAATGMALLGTILAANVPLLDANIKSLTPVLRDNYWLTVHVLTIVSSYAAFTLALGLGLLALGYYLSATYRSDVTYTRAGSPLLLGLPLLAVGTLGLIASSQGWFGGAFRSVPGYLLTALAAVPGLMLSVGGLFALMGEFANRRAASALLVGVGVAAVGTVATMAVAPRTPPDWWLKELPMTFIPGAVALSGAALAVLGLLGAQSRRVLLQAEAQAALDDRSHLAQDAEALAAAPVGATAAAQAAGTATIARPSVAEIRARAAASRPKLDPRGLAMQSVAGQIKPLANFLYRSMQVGVLLVAAGTILGGVWADVSWGRFWGWDPKEVWALITLLVYLVPLHGRFAGWVNTFWLVAASVFCYMSVLMAWYGVNFVLGVGLHSYGFTEGGGQGVVVGCSLAIMGIVVGAAWRRWLGSRSPAAIA